MINFSVFTSHAPTVLSKRITLGADGQLEQVPAASMIKGEVQKVSVSSAAEFANVLDALSVSQAVGFGVAPADWVEIAAVSKLAQNPNAIARTKENFIWPNTAGVLMFDYDPEKGSDEVLTQNEFISAIFTTAPMLANAPWVWRPSASSHIVNTATGVDLTGLRGQRLYVFVANAGDIERAGAALAKRLWLAGHGRAEVARTGTILPRTIIDTAVWQTNRLDFAAGADCVPPLAAVKTAAVVSEGAGPVDTAVAIPDLSPGEHVQYEQLVESVKAGAASKSDEARQAYAADRAVAWGVSTEEANERLIAATDDRYRVLDRDHPVEVMIDGGYSTYTVKELLADPARFHLAHCRDPLEPDYKGGDQVGKIYIDNKSQHIWSLAHGGYRVFMAAETAGAFVSGMATPPAVMHDYLDGLMEDPEDEAAYTGLLIGLRGASNFSTHKTIERIHEITGMKYAAIQKDLKALESEGAPAAQTPAPQQAPMMPAGVVLDMSTPVHANHWAPFQTKGKEMKPKGTIDNFKIMLGSYGVTARKNVTTKEYELIGRNGELSYGIIESLAELNEFPQSRVLSCLMEVATEYKYNPVFDYINSCPWDGMDHVGHLFGQIILEDGEDRAMAETLFRKWFRGAAAIGCGAINKYENVLTLVDPVGGTGKTRFFNTLSPPDLQKEGVMLDPANRDSVKQAISCWLVELGELDATFNRADQARLKAFMTNSKDEIRLPYARTTDIFDRTTAFFASVNETKFLIDSSSNRRFWPIRVKRLNFQHNVNIQQVWAQALQELMTGHYVYLTDEEETALYERNEDFRAATPVEDLLSRCFVPGEEEHKHFTITEALRVSGMQNPTKVDLNAAGHWLRRAGFRESKYCGIKGFWLPEPTTQRPDYSEAFKKE